MYESSKHANWLLATLLITLLISSLILGWLLTVSGVLAGPDPSITQQFAQASLAAPMTGERETEPTIKPAAPVKAELNTQPSLDSLSLFASQQNLEQAAVIPTAILPLASLAASPLNPKLAKTLAPEALTPEGLAAEEPLNPVLAKTGWIYAGHFQNGKWSLMGLALPSNTLPLPNGTYKTLWGSRVRSAPPGQRFNTEGSNLAEAIDYLAEGSDIQVISVKSSGKTGHIWLEISYGE